LLRGAAVGLLCCGLFFGLAETAVLVLTLLAVGPFSHLKREPLADRMQDVAPVLLVAAAGYAVAALGYFLDRALVKVPPEDREA
jgi:hypothetical protein